MSKFLYLLLIASLTVAHASPTADSPAAAAAAASGAGDDGSDGSAPAGGASAAASSAAPGLSSPTPCDLEAKPGGIYRVSAAATPADNVLGVYAKDVRFGNSSFEFSLPRVSDETKDYVNELSKPEESAAASASASSVTQKPKNAMAIVFFAVWRTEFSGGRRNFFCKKNPVSNDDGKIMIWSRSIPEGLEVPDGYAVVIPEKGAHTEDAALDYLQRKDTQERLWELISLKKRKTIDAESRRTLEMLGISIYSRLDACDSCLMKLSTFNGKGFEYLPPPGITCVRSPVPCVVAFDALERYQPGLTSDKSLSNGECSATLCVVPKHPFLKIGRESDDISYTHQLLTAFGGFQHMNEITLTSGMNPSFIIFCVNNGEEIRMSVPN